MMFRHTDDREERRFDVVFCYDGAEHPFAVVIKNISKNNVLLEVPERTGGFEYVLWYRTGEGLVFHHGDGGNPSP